MCNLRPLVDEELLVDSNQHMQFWDKPAETINTAPYQRIMDEKMKSNTVLDAGVVTETCSVATRSVPPRRERKRRQSIAKYKRPKNRN